jgi:hypothetical protein
VVALVNHDESVFSSQLFKIVSTSEALDHSDIDHAELTIATASQLTDTLRRQAEVLRKTIPPLINERLAINDHERGHVSMRNQRAGEHGLSCSWRGHKDAEIVVGKRFESSLLLRREHSLEPETLMLWLAVLLADLEPTARREEDRAGLLLQTARKEKFTETLPVAAYETRGVVIREPKPFVLVELRIVD